MREIFVGLLLVVMFAAIGWSAYDANLRLKTTQEDLENARADSAACHRKMQMLEGERSNAEKAANSILNKTTIAQERLKQELATAGTEKQQLLAQVEALAAKLADARRDAIDANKAALKAQHDSCPPPEVISEKTLEQKFAPVFQRPDGTKTWQTDFDWDESKAKEMGRLQFVAWGTESCPHCDWFLKQCSTQAVGVDVFRNYVPCYVTVQDRETSKLADRFGVNEFKYPGAMLRDPNTGKFELWRPSKDNAKLQREIAEHAKALNGK